MTSSTRNVHYYSQMSTYLRNFWVKKHYPTPDGRWMVFLHGFLASSMLEALLKSAKRKRSELKINEVTDKLWRADVIGDEIKFVVYFQDAQPELVPTEYNSVRDETVPWNEEKKKLPKSLFSQPDLFS